MGVHVVVGHVNHAAGDVGAVVTDALQGSQQVGPDEAGFDAAISLLQPQNVVDPQLFLQIVNDLFQRLHLLGGLQVLGPEGIEGQGYRFVNGFHQYLEFVLGGVGQLQTLLVQLLGRFQQVQGVVADPLKVVQGF